MKKNRKILKKIIDKAKKLLYLFYIDELALFVSEC